MGVHADEASLVKAMAVLFAVTQASQGLGANTADALFFVRFGVESLPLMILISGPVAMVATMAHVAGLGKLGAQRWLPRILWLLAAAVALAWGGVVAEAPGIYPAVWLGTQAVMLISFTVMWNAAGEVCNARQAKRLYPLFASAGIGGGVIGNAATGPLASALSADHLLLVEAGILAASALVLNRVATRFFPERATAAQSSAVAEMRAGLAVVRRIPLLRLVSWTAVALSILFFLVSFPFSREVADSFGDEVAVASFLGIFSAVATALTFLVSLLVANRLLARLGVVAVLLIVVAVYLVGFGGWLISFSLLTATLFRGAQWIAVNALGGTAWSSLFNVLTGSARGQAMAFVSGVPTQIGTMISGAILLVAPLLTSEAITVAGIALALATGIVVYRMRPAYTRALMEAISQGSAEVFAARTPGIWGETIDAEASAALRSALTGNRPEARVLALSVLARANPRLAGEALGSALTDPEPRVRLTALETAVRLGDGALQANVLISDPSPLVRRRAVAILRQDGQWTLEARERALRSSDPVVRAAAAEVAAPEEGRAVIQELAGNEDAGAVVAALTAVARRPQLAPEGLLGLSRHPNRRVRAALAGAIRHNPAGPQHLAAMLDDPSPSVRSAAAQSLAASTETVPLLFDTLDHGTLRASEVALAALSHLGGGVEARLRGWAQIEVDRARFLRRHRQALAPGAVTDTRRYLVRLLSTREQWLERRALLALARTNLAPGLSEVERGIWSADQEIKAQALEALDTMTKEAHPLIRLLEEDLSGQATDAQASLLELAGDFDEWIRALAVRSLAEDLQSGLERLRATAASDPSPLVQIAMSRWELPQMHQSHQLDKVDRVLALQRVPIFSGIDPEDLEHVAVVATERSYEPGELIYREGEEGKEMMVVVSGEVEIQRPLGTVIRSYGTGEPVGELALLRGRARSANVVAGTGEVTALTLSALEFESILEERPEVAMAMLATLAERLGTQH